MTDRSGGSAYPLQLALLKPDDGTFVLLDEYGLCERGMSARLKIVTTLIAAYENAAIPYTVDGVFVQAEDLIAREAERAKRDVEPDAAIEPALTCEVVVDLLGLVDCVVPIETVETWTEAQREEAADWAGALHGLASDNDVEVPPEPEWTKMYRVDYKGHYVNKPDAALAAGAEALKDDALYAEWGGEGK